MANAQQELLPVVLRQLHVAMKTFGLYSAEHAVAQSVLPGFSATLQNFLRAAGPLTVHVGRDRLGIAGESLQDGGAASLAYYLYLRNIASVSILPGVTERELGALLSALSLDRQSLDASGGIGRRLDAADLAHVVVTAVTLSHDQDPALAEIDALGVLLHGDRLSPEQRELVLDTLRDGPEATARMLTALHDFAAQAGDRPVIPALVQALDTLDRTILDEPLEDQEALFASLARAHVLLEEPLRSNIMRELITRASAGGAARSVVSELNGGEIAQLLLGMSEREAATAQISSFLNQLTFLPEKIPEIVAALQPALAAHGVSVEPPPLPPAPADRGPEDEWTQIPAEMIELAPGEERALQQDVEDLAGSALAAQTVITLSNLLYLEEEPEQLVETASILAGHLPGLAAGGRLDLVVSGLQSLRAAADRAGPHRAGVEGAIARLLDQGVLDTLVAAGLREGEPITLTAREALRQVAADAVPRMIRLLERETQATRRRQLCRLLADVARSEPDLVGMHLPSAGWFLTRNLVFVMGELGHPDGVRHVLRVSRDADFRVRREVIDALRKIGDGTSRTALLWFFDDPETRIQHHLIETIDAREDTRAGEPLIRVLADRDVSPRAVVLKTAAMRALDRMQFDAALPVIRRLARGRWAFGRNRRAIRDAARQIVATWRTTES